MDLERKLAIFETYDFSRSGELKRAGKSLEKFPYGGFHGIASILHAISDSGYCLVQGGDLGQSDFNLWEEHMLMAYGWFQLRYNQIDWDELNACSDDPDLIPFFQTRDLLSKLTKHIYSFLEKSRREFPGYTPGQEYTSLTNTLSEFRIVLLKYKEIYHKLRAQKNPHTNYE
ncbi:hypothetical protein HYU14_07275 [Candidatus Woesearchaeota archaeon]|nr:hypothetical protein [Candidatus Woesearchaeota archaeon]